MILADWRDIAIIAMVLFFTVQTLVVIILVSFLIKLAMEIKDRADVILASTHTAVHSIHGTATFVGDTVASPIIRSVSFASGMGRTVRTLAGLTRRKGR